MLKIAPYTFGVEIECFGAPREEVRAAFREVGLCVDNYDWNGYDSKTWVIGGDGSVVGEHAMEIKSPILKGVEGLGMLATAMDALQGIGVQANLSCGLHVHVGVTANADRAYNFTPKMIHELLRQWAAHETESDLLVHPSRRAEGDSAGSKKHRNGYCQPVSNFLQNFERAVGPKMYGPEKPPEEYLSLVRGRQDYYTEARIRELLNYQIGSGWGAYYWPSDRRYHPEQETMDLNRIETKALGVLGNHVTAVDIYSLSRYGTVEFRQHHGTVDAKEACAWVRFVVNRLEQVRLGTAGENRSVVDGLEEEDILHFIDQAARFEKIEREHTGPWKRY
jgi:hypothetical protein